MSKSENNYSSFETFFSSWRSFLYKIFIQPVLLRRNSAKKERFLELGPGNARIPGFETMNLVKDEVTDYVGDVVGNLPFRDDAFDIVYASHILEHVPWYQVDNVLGEWRRILKPGGRLEIWVPYAQKIAKAFVAAEETGDTDWQNDNWYRFNDARDPAVWFGARMFSYGDGRGTRGHRNWHLSCFSPRLLRQHMVDCGFKNVRLLPRSAVRGYDHGWINLGCAGEK